MKNYIFGTGPFSIQVAQLLDNLNVVINGFLKISSNVNDKTKTLYKNIPIIYLNDNFKLDSNSCNIIIAKQPMIMGETIEYLRKNNFNKVYIANDRIINSNNINSDNISNYFDIVDLKVPFLNYLETNIVDHCNLNCKGCAHFSNIAPVNFVSIEHYINDLKEISRKFNLYYFRILGGEPLMHPDILEIIKMSRAILTSTNIVIVTNGLLIPKLNEEILKAISDNNIRVSLSLYKPTANVLNIIIDKLKKYNIEYLINDNYYNKPKIIETFETRLTINNTNNGDLTSKICTGRFCRFLRDGKIAKCYYPLLISILNEKYNIDFKLSKKDYVDIYGIKDGWDAIDYLNNPIPFCNYCSEELCRFDWQGYCKNTDNISGFILKKVL